ncbi:SSU ribosomal protein S3AE [Methanosarcina thermophila]|uniref:Small ribosomal subunit protein eS1 n=3 Tax=Methanosarcina thermophila TaxID=2210 RepID=A0A1I7A7R0_METTE|nr:30S ribosomal protein S3ae [Methanosarcina thermophila]ALK05556.1 MAG: 30S ribosomal protein S3Ae [Methanosarcina sp. 795]AKB11831.1 SSU ribosomal protein S3Ae [Methanosarcina thermophila TM-1]AKB14975.1 SSU ribosomal protein S3Ae [Methanosarcina thermophila CHTI-55]NLU56779.1 30S ribosomal protein S3ae [Methanosarcina thermophila]SFT70890.1 SSU ribosomal protein S3AE [Methanosarcina thermophila]
MARKKVQRKLDGWKSKEWFNIEAPVYLNRAIVGTTMASDPSLLIGRNVETTVGELTNDITKNNTKVILRINNVVGDVATTDLIGHELTTDYVRSIVKRQTSRIDANIDVTTKDGYVIRVKPTCFTIKRARSSQIKAIREIMVDIVQKRASETDFETFMQEAILGRLSAAIYRQAKSIYPLRRVEIRKTQVKTAPALAPAPAAA